MAKLRIDTMRIVVPHGSAGEAERLGRQVAAELAKSRATVSPGRIPSLRLTLTEPTLRSPAAIARAIREKLG